MYYRSNILPETSSVLILEDDNYYIDETQGMFTALNSKVSIARNGDQFISLLNKPPFDVISIDCEIDEIRIGNLMLERAIQMQPDSAKVILTAYPNEKRKLSKLNYDWFFLKDNLFEYEKKIDEAICLGKNRRIYNYLKKLNYIEIEEININEMSNSNFDEALFNAARSIAEKSILERKKDKKLISIISERGWWRNLDKEQYVKMSSIEKLGLFTEYLHISVNDLGSILDIEPSKVNSAIENKERNLDENTKEKVDDFISIMSYLLKITKYTPEMLSYYWNKNCMYKDSLNKPPWHDLGLSNYLSKLGHWGINESMNWIRSR
jgi:CheY-like chemotaxis protein